ncbi:winged helix DNA-binding domain-containing protein [Svornostia abyssi]|uniref:Winged helix DNA-binding domain-containing protein n=1 Tax=Svornostia abyssi TaxID=2898438 RepID=A0ABY5PML6_9ACTN|nr:winged helix DNA-binding domain-containing protein [Parviterribacteraceae bacterium J379]
MYLSAWARVDGMALADVDRALYEDRSLVKHLAMRRTLFVFPRATLPAAVAGPSARVAAAERKRLIKEIDAQGLHGDGAAWLAKATDAVMALLADGRAHTSTELREQLPVIQGKVTSGSGKWAATIPVGPRVLTVLSAEGRVVRGPNDGAWTVSRPRWTSMAAWLGEPVAPMDEQDGTTELVRGWLRAFGPGTVADMKWWLGGTVRGVKAALAALAAVEVDLGGGETGWVLPDDVEPEPPVEPWAALLPSLDPTIMGWQSRDWYLAPHREHLFDYAGNAGHSAWWDGRAVGGWRQTEDGAIELQLLEDVGTEALTALETEADRLTNFLSGTRSLPRFPSPLSKQ